MLKCLRNLQEISRFYHYDLFVQDNESMSRFGVMRGSVLGEKNDVNKQRKNSPSVIR